MAKYQALQETTNWGDTTPNHIYLFSESRKNHIVGFVASGSEQPHFFSKPLFFDRRGRTFKPVKLEIAHEF